MALRSLGKPGAIEIVIRAPGISLRGALIVERKRDGKWIETPVVFQRARILWQRRRAGVRFARGRRHRLSGPSRVERLHLFRSMHPILPVESLQRARRISFAVLTCDRSQRFVSEPFLWARIRKIPEAAYPYRCNWLSPMVE